MLPHINIECSEKLYERLPSMPDAHRRTGSRSDPVSAHENQLQSAVKTDMQIVIFGVTLWVPLFTPQTDSNPLRFKGQAQIVCQSARSQMGDPG